jgi:hypothetical protein
VTQFAQGLQRRQLWLAGAPIVFRSLALTVR